jgi:hypothetical protein
MKYSLYNTVVFLLFSVFLHAQKIDNTASFRDMQSNRYFRINYENDFFTASDRYYTQGYQLELVIPWLRKNPVNHLLLRLNNSEQKYGLLFENLGYIPTSIKEAGIQYGDRPYAATMALKSFIVSTDTLHKSRLSSSLVVGMTGPVALGNEIQTGIHRWIGDEIPQGWHNQIRNDVVLDYELAYEKQLYRFHTIATVNLDTKAHLGTFNTFASAGINAALGILNSPFSSIKNKKKFTAYVFTQPRIKVIGYDASLQGGLFTKSPYTISSSGTERFVIENNYGIIIQFRTLYFEYFRNDITEEFKTGRSHKWGGFKIGFTI